jgi:large subunit ribosomal protein L6
MSRIGRLPVQLRSGVEVKVAQGVVHVKGPKGQLSQAIPPLTRVEVTDGQVVVHREAEDKRARAMHGLARALLNNMVAGVTEGFERGLEIVGVGYRAAVQGRKLSLSIGFSHPVEVAIPQGLEVAAEGQTRLVVRGIDKQKVGQFAAEIRRIRPPEPYKGKGIRYAGEQVRRKVGKAGASS